MRTLLESHPKFNDSLVWVISRKMRSQPAECSSCFQTKVCIGDVLVKVDGLFLKDDDTIMATTFMFCIGKNCCRKGGSRRTNTRPFLDDTMALDPKTKLEPKECEDLKTDSIKPVLKIRIGKTQ